MTRARSRTTVLLATATVALASEAVSQQMPNTLTDAERAEGWMLLFDGKTLEGWRGYNMEGLPGSWAVEEGTITRVAAGGDLITDRQYEDFELTFEWRVGTGGNSGVFYRVVEGLEYAYFGAPEYQVLDDANHVDGGDPVTSAGSNYALNPAPRGVVRSAGQWNSGRIVVRGDYVEHWLNGVLTVSYELHSPEWKALVAASKFAAWPAYGMAPRGHIGIQDHGDRVWYRNLKLRVL